MKYTPLKFDFFSVEQKPFQTDLSSKAAGKRWDDPLLSIFRVASIMCKDLVNPDVSNSGVLKVFVLND